MGMANRTFPQYNVLFEVPKPLYFEAEWGALHPNFAPFTVETNAEASNGLYVDWIGDGTLNDTSPADSDPGQFTWTFSLDVPCDLRLAAVVNFPDDRANSFYTKLDGGSWQYVAVNPTVGFEPVSLRTYNQVAAGTHTLSILKREDGAQIDRLILYPMEYANIAQGKPVAVDSTFSAAYAAENAVDGNNSDNASRWLSADTPFPHWIEVDLQGEYDISHMGFWNGYDGYNNGPSDFQFQRWDGTAWVDIFSETGVANSKFNRGVPTLTTSKVRFVATGGASQIIRMYEIEVFGIPHTPPTPSALTIAQDGSEIVISSPSSTNGASLLHSQDLGNYWMPVDTTPTETGGAYEWREAIECERCYYQLLND
jgi:hypothetical protein